MGVLKKTVRSYAKKAKKFVKKRYGLNKKAKGVNTGAIARDVAKLAMMINAEKKYFQYPTNSFTMGQVLASGSGAVALDMTPYITQGTDATTRNGNSIKLTTSMFQFQFIQQANAVTDVNIIVDMIQLMVPITSFGVASLANIYDPGVFSGVIDYFSPRNQNHYAQYKVVRSFRVHLKGDQVSPETTIKSVAIPHKWNRGKGHHIRYQSNSGGAADIANGQILMVFRADTGNSAPTIVSTLPVAQTGVLTGCTVFWNFKHYYYDN